MENRQGQLARLRGYNRAVQEGDPKLAEEIRDTQTNEEVFVESKPEDVDRQIQEEAIVMRRGRPVLAIFENVAKLEFRDEFESQTWKERLNLAMPILAPAIPAVGRIDLRGGQLDWVGTGWLVADNILVTNRHVAREFVVRKGEGFTFRMGLSGQMSGAVDFLQEIENPRQLVFNLVKPLHVEDTNGPDVAFFEIEVLSGDAKLAKPIALAGEVSADKLPGHVATIGYPAYDSRTPETQLMEDIYGRIYNKKRLAPGEITRVDETRIWHNCTTLGGNSGSVVLDLEKGSAIGLHFSGSFLTTNYAVRADVVKKLLADLRGGRIARRGDEKPNPQRPAVEVRPGRPTAVAASLQGGRSGATLTIPLTLNVTLGIDGVGGAAVGRPRLPVAAADAAATPDLIDETEAVAADYRDREGYNAAFLGKKFTVDLPEVTRNARDVLEFEDRGGTETELRYEHYSVIMSKSRRMCFLSACNIDGNLSRKSARVAWKFDPRIPKAQQIMKECYGSPPKFSRGHMTRREDPGWGTPKEAKRGNEDSMHVTNTTPQMQAFNAPIWLALEDYALQHAREDDMKISVFTGPYFSDRDPEMFGVRIPLAFWKIIAFIHDETGKLCATGYEMNQEHTLQPEEEFVFGQFVSKQLGTATQVSIRSIEARSGLSFGKLAAVDPKATDEESVDGGAVAPLLSLEQIRFV